ncbi:DUF1853 family protein [Cupriavidus basilensis]|uniref:DUF1853 family protein n=1 Tax=Cupriavidus basilensis TaxID=68895 RepID=A0ABT6AT59_9BURK|nr:DUF1853 family protein [Cupriavidus basilensis]MDF3835795.1 DUF1853 family protein [Cupriavidus basilensis]
MREPRPEFALSPGGAIDLAPLWRHAASQRLRELAWCSLSPPLLAFLPADDAAGPLLNGTSPVPETALARWPEGALAAWQRWLAGADPALLPPTIAELAAGLQQPRAPDTAPAPSLRLGRHAERLLQFTLEHAEGLELLAANLPVRRVGSHGVQTLGELDFVWRDVASGATVHWEMAAKFYLLVEPVPAAGGMPGSGDGSEDGRGNAVLERRCFVGPNLVDRLGDKLEHIVRRQLPLSHTPEALALLGRPVDRSEVYLLGWLFYRDGVVPADIARLGIAPDHLHGWWSSLQDWSDWARARDGSRWYRLPRSAWMAPARVAQAHTETAEAVHEALALRFAETHHDKNWRREAPVMLCEVEPAGQPGMWRERTRGFVVPPGWEERARERIARQAG